MDHTENIYKDRDCEWLRKLNGQERTGDSPLSEVLHGVGIVDIGDDDFRSFGANSGILIDSAET